MHVVVCVCKYLWGGVTLRLWRTSLRFYFQPTVGIRIKPGISLNTQSSSCVRLPTDARSHMFLIKIYLSRQLKQNSWEGKSFCNHGRNPTHPEYRSVASAKRIAVSFLWILTRTVSERFQKLHVCRPSCHPEPGQLHPAARFADENSWTERDPV
jgi:hypothetical protein